MSARPDVAAPPPPPRAGDRPSCGIGARGFALIGGGATMGQLANVLSGRADRVVIDRTGLAGTFDLDLSWTPSGGSVPPGVQPTDPDTWLPIFTALQDQLGLKVEPSRASVDVLVIDHVEPLSPD